MVTTSAARRQQLNASSHFLSLFPFSPNRVACSHVDCKLDANCIRITRTAQWRMDAVCAQQEVEMQISQLLFDYRSRQEIVRIDNIFVWAI